MCAYKFIAIDKKKIWPAFKLALLFIAALISVQPPVFTVASARAQAPDRLFPREEPVDEEQQHARGRRQCDGEPGRDRERRGDRENRPGEGQGTGPRSEDGSAMPPSERWEKTGTRTSAYGGVKA